MPAWIEHTLQDVRYSLRGLRRNPGFTLTAVLAAAIAIGATTAVFSAVDRILFRPLPYRDEGRLVSAGMMAPLDSNEFLLADAYFDLRRNPGPLAAVTSFPTCLLYRFYGPTPPLWQSEQFTAVKSPRSTGCLKIWAGNAAICVPLSC